MARLGDVMAYPSGAFRALVASRFVLPAQPTQVARPPAGPVWIHEVKHDN
jgi:hypothetical protein